MEILNKKKKMNNFHILFLKCIIILQIIILSFSELPQCEYDLPIRKRDEGDGCMNGEYCTKQQYQTGECIIGNKKIETQWLNNFIIFEEIDFVYISITTSLNGKLIGLFTTDDPYDTDRLFFCLNNVGRGNLISPLTGEIVLTYKKSHSDFQPRQNLNVFTFKLNNGNTDDNEYLISISNNEILEMYILGGYFNQFDMWNLFTKDFIISSYSNVLLPIENNLYTLGFIVNENNNHYFYLFKVDFSDFVISSQQILDYKSFPSGDSFIVSCFQSDKRYIICFYIGNMYNYQEIVLDQNYNVKANEIILPVESSADYFKGVHFTGETAAFLYYNFEHIPTLIFKKYNEDDDSIINHFEYLELIELNLEDSNSEISFNDLVKIEEFKLCYTSVIDNDEDLYLTIIDNYDQLNEKINIRYYKINLYKLYSYELINGLCTTIYNNFISLGSSFYRTFDEEIYFSSFSILVFSYPNSTDFTINLNNNFIIDLNSECRIENNIFGLIYNGIRLISISEGYNLISTHYGRELGADDYIYEDEKIILDINKGRDIPQNGRIVFALELIEPNYNIYKDYAYSFQNLGGHDTEENFFIPKTYIGRHSYCDIIAINDGLIIQDCNSQNCKYCLTNQACISCENNLLLHLSEDGNTILCSDESSSPNGDTTTPDTETTTPDIETTIPDIETTIPDIGTTIPDIETTIPDIETTIPDIETTIPDIETTIPGIETTIPDIETTIPDIETTIPDIETSIPDIETSIPDIETTIPDIETTIPDIETTFPDIKSTILDIKTTILDIETTIPDIKSTILDIKTTIPDINTTIPKIKDSTFLENKDSTIPEIIDIESIINNNETKNNCTNEEIKNNKCKGTITIKQIEDIKNYLLKSNRKNEIIKTEKVIIQYSTLEEQNQLEIPEVSSIDLGECDNILKDYYKIPEDESLIIFKLDIKTEDLLSTYVYYEVYSPIDLIKLELDLCKEVEIIINTPVILDDSIELIYNSLYDSGYNLFDGNDSFYQDICAAYTTVNGTDILLSDRKKDLFNTTQNTTICQTGCELEKYDSKTKKAKCNCNVKNENVTDLYVDNLFDKKEIEKNFYNTLANSNFRVLKCYKLIISPKFIKNIGGIFMSSILILLIILIFFSCTKGPEKIHYLINIILKNIQINKKQNFNNATNQNPGKDVDENPKKKQKYKKKNKKINRKSIYYPPKRYDKKSKTVVNKGKISQKTEDINSKSNMVKNNTKNKNKNKRKTAIYSLNNSNKMKLNKEKKSDSNINLKRNKKLSKKFISRKSSSIYSIKNSKRINPNKLSINKVKNITQENLNDQELNTLEYDKAILYDKRTYIQYYWSLLKKKQLIFFTFLPANDYNIYSVKISLFLLSFALFFTINGFFFSDETMHKIYEDKGIFDILFQIPQILYSTVISAIINMILKTLSLSEKNILEIKQEKDYTKAVEKSQKIEKCIKTKFVLFFFLSFTFMIFFWYFISCFCAVYTNTQIILIKDTLISFGISLVYPFGLNLLPGMFRMCSLKAEKKDKKCLYNFSNIIALI